MSEGFKRVVRALRLQAEAKAQSRSNAGLDACILRALASNGGHATYVIRNILAASWHPEHGDWTGLGTARVLRGCRRLEKRGLIKEARSSYLVMKCWQLTEAGRAVVVVSREAAA